MATVVAFGRRMQNGEELSDEQWEDFKVSVLTAVHAYTGEVFFAGEGTGNYEGELEGSMALVIGDDLGDSPTPLFYLRKALKRLAGEYDQEAIALLEGLTRFITPE